MNNVNFVPKRRTKNSTITQKGDCDTDFLLTIWQDF